MWYHLVPLKKGLPVKGLCVTKLNRCVEVTVFMKAIRDMQRYKLHKIDVDSLEIYKGNVENMVLLATIYSDGIQCNATQ